MFSYRQFPNNRWSDWTWNCLGFLKNTDSCWMLLRDNKCHDAEEIDVTNLL